MKAWAASPEALLISALGRRVWFDLECGGYLPADWSTVCSQLVELSLLSPDQVVFWHSDSEALVVCSYPDPDEALRSLKQWAGSGAEVQVMPAALLAMLN